MNTKTQCYECGRVATGCRQILGFEPGGGWHIVKLLPEDVLEAVKKGWKGRYICPECYDFEVTVMHSWVKLQPSPLGPLDGKL